MRTMLAVTIGVVAMAAAAIAEQPPPVIRHLGPVEPTPAPAPEAAEHIRLITSFTLRNKPDGDSLISFETTDLSKTTDKKKTTNYRVLSNDNYSLTEPKKEVKALHDEILRKVRELETNLLEYAERAGPPRERQPVTRQPAERRR